MTVLVGKLFGSYICRLFRAPIFTAFLEHELFFADLNRAKLVGYDTSRGESR